MSLFPAWFVQQGTIHVHVYRVVTRAIRGDWSAEIIRLGFFTPERKIEPHWRMVEMVLLPLAPTHHVSVHQILVVICVNRRSCAHCFVATVYLWQQLR